MSPASPERGEGRQGAPTTHDPAGDGDPRERDAEQEAGRVAGPGQDDAGRAIDEPRDQPRDGHPSETDEDRPESGGEAGDGGSVDDPAAGEPDAAEPDDAEPDDAEPETETDAEESSTD
ncbi:MAG TPA: hypothetical protein VFV40_02425 [Nocardioides sp.]|nr:hypothetical protein [Nocardioides sp.]